jgi:hypothetical protein
VAFFLWKTKSQNAETLIYNDSFSANSSHEPEMKLINCLLLSVLGIVGCTSSTTPPPAGAQASTVETTTESNRTDASQLFGDFSFSIPNGWTVVNPDRKKTKAMLLLDGTTWQNAKAMIKVDVGMPAAPTAKQTAESFAKSAKGSVSPETMDFDGEPGFIALTSSAKLTTPRIVIVLYHDGKAYLLMIGATDGIDVDDAVSHIRKSWKWN